MEVISDERDRVRINVGGRLFVTTKATLQSIPDTKLALLNEDDSSFDTLRGEYFFDRSPGLFESLLDYYRTGKFHVPTYLCCPFVRQELDYWGVEEVEISHCCSHILRNYDLEQERRKVVDKYMEQDTIEPEPDAAGGCKSGFKRCCSKLWLILENPSSSPIAKTIGISLITAVITSVWTSVI